MSFKKAIKKRLGQNTKDQEILDIISDETNLTIITMLKAEPSYVRKIAQQLGMKESHVSDRLRKMEKVGLVSSSWVRIYNKNVKLYYSVIDLLEISFTQIGYVIRGKDKESEIIIPHNISENALPKVKFFIGRRAELEFIRSWKGPVIIWGMPGIGKTTLVAKFIWDNGMENRTFWYNCKEIDTFQYFLGKLAAFTFLKGYRTLPNYMIAGVKDFSMLIDVAINEIINNDILLVFDNYDLCKDESIKLFVNQLIEKGKKLFLISRKPIKNVPKTDVIHLQGMDEDEIKEFFSAICNKSYYDVLSYASKLGGNPLGLHFLCTSTLSEDEKSLTNSFKEWLIAELRKMLSNEHMKILEQLSVFNSPISLDSLRSLIHIKGFINYLRDLENMSLVNTSGQNYWISYILKDIIYENSSSQEELHKKAAYYHLKFLDPFSRLEAMYHFIKAGEIEEALSLVNYLPKLANAGLLEKVNDLFKDVTEEELSPNGRIKFKYFKALYLYLSGKINEAVRLFEDIESIIRSIKDWETYAQLLYFLCSSYIVINNHERAKQVCEKGMKIYEKRNSIWFSKIATLMAEVYEETGKLDNSLNLLQRALDSIDKLDIENRASILHQIAMVYYRKGDIKNSRIIAESALEIYRKTHNLFGSGYCEWIIASIFIEEGDPILAMEYYNKAIEDLTRCMASGHLVVCLSERSVLNLRLGNIEKSREDIEKVDLYVNKIQEPLLQGIALRGISIYVAEVEKNIGKAISYLMKSLELIDELVIDEKALTLWTLGLLELKSGMKDQGVAHLKEAKKILREVGWESRAIEVEKAINAVINGDLNNLYPKTARSYL
ncbi:tetratricopeptide repeat protein [Saccharolobus shibatae]|uniref:HTH arsR-type domain-containing protein n=1 Tax=Saccharolobus shibatae TaxID=2286 RepID=A0A8F5BZ50_9CREN|nr:tetratricopeptide repeat protein [Saccharolobus shibatae]QXJ34158.1 hypothetical protein J5U22_00703 [Saccharolobus shibatae]